MPLLNIPRRVEPEWLDELAPGDPRAIRSRQDLRRINALMANAAIVARELRHGFRNDEPRRVADLGAGDGTFMLRVARKTRWKNIHLVLLDRQNIVSSETRAELQSLGWKAECVAADVFEWLAQPPAPLFDVIIANLFLHHFDAARLALLLSLASGRSRMVLACEPRRSGAALTASSLLGLIGCNDVSRHDARASVHAGFNGRELSGLWQQNRGWTAREFGSGMFSHCFVARRSGESAATTR